MGGTRRPGDSGAERALVGAILRFPADADDAMTTLTEKDFDHTGYRNMFVALREQYLSDTWGSGGADWVQLAAKAKVEGSTIMKMSDEAISGAQIPGLIRRLKDLTRRRAMVDAGILMAEKAHDYSIDSEELLAQAGSYIDDAAVSEAKEPVALIDVVEQVFDNYQGGKSMKGVPTGLTDLDDLWAGFIAPELTVMAARPSMGKSQLAFYLASQVAEYMKLPVAVYSLEMSTDQVALRYIASELGVEVDQLRREMVSKEKVESMSPQILTKYAKSQIMVQDEPNLSTIDILGQARQMKRTKGLGLLVVDYLNLLADKKESGDTRATLFEEMTRRIRSIGKKLNVPVLLLAQLNRDCEKRDNKRPVMSDLKESGGIEASSDNIIFLYRENYYKPEITDNTLEVILAKQKQGPRGVTAYVIYEPETGRFFNLAKEHQGEGKKVWGGGIQ